MFTENLLPLRISNFGGLSFYFFKGTSIVNRGEWKKKKKKEERKETTLGNFDVFDTEVMGNYNFLPWIVSSIDVTCTWESAEDWESHSRTRRKWQVLPFWCWSRTHTQHSLPSTWSLSPDKSPDVLPREEEEKEGEKDLWPTSIRFTIFSHRLKDPRMTSPYIISLSYAKNNNLDMRKFWTDVHHPNTKSDTLDSCPVSSLSLFLSLSLPLPPMWGVWVGWGWSGLVFVYLALLIYWSIEFHNVPKLASIS